MAKPMFTPEELEELRRFDEELDDSFVQTQEEIRESRKRDREAKLRAMEPERRKIAEYQAAYYEANREKRNAYMREYMRKRRAAKKMEAATKDKEETK